MATIAEVVPMYIKLRDHIESLEKQHKAAVKALKDKLEAFDVFLLDQLTSRGEKSVAIEAVGTVFTKREVTCRVADWGATFPWIRTNERWDMLNHAVNKTVVTAYVEENQEAPPGLDYRAVLGVSVQRARGT